MNDDEECWKKWEEIEEKIKVNKNFSVLNWNCLKLYKIRDNLSASNRQSIVLLGNCPAIQSYARSSPIFSWTNRCPLCDMHKLISSRMFNQTSSLRCLINLSKFSSGGNTSTKLVLLPKPVYRRRIYCSTWLGENIERRDVLLAFFTKYIFHLDIKM